ncbi:WGR domain-containing protein [Rhizobium rhizophilum]|uniref:WGR domain-containing protein n=1 Tax=Rhizobium rhizophilum TaxID=1850373 RepID=A0ABY2QSZ3_9HYPH|nr:WGR domain-containing protein [Rhizobium rhizophilum]THV12800.1 WGR domain-containing protein [Rhizobium rhizophilum]
MITQPYKIYCERHEPDRNMARYYTMEIAPDLFGQTCLIRSWGRIGKRGQQKHHQFAQEGEAVRLFLDILRKKRRRGYQPPPPNLKDSLGPTRIEQASPSIETGPSA